MASRKLEDLYPPLKKAIEESLEEAKAKGIDVVVTCTKRSPQEQEALYAQGREALTVVNKKREAVGLVRLKEAGNKRKVTWTLKSYHTCEPLSMAVDFVVGTKTKIYWDLKVDVNDNDIPDYKEFAEICKSKSDKIEWGGDFLNSKDCPHIQWKNGMNIDQTLKEKVKKEEVLEVKDKKVIKSGGFFSWLKNLKLRNSRKR